MARIPVKIDPNSNAPREVLAVFYVDGKEYTQIVAQVPEFAVPHVIATAYAQIDDPDIEGARDD